MSNIDKQAGEGDVSPKTYYIHPMAFGGTQNPGHGHVPVVKAEDVERLRAKLEAAEKRIAELEARTLVPVEPTLDQLVAGKRRLTSSGRMSRLMSQRLAEVYRAMVNAAAAGKGE